MDSVAAAKDSMLQELKTQMQELQMQNIMLQEQVEISGQNARMDSIAAEQRKHRIDSLRNVTTGSPLVIDGDTLLFSVRDDGAGFDPDTAPGVLQGHFGLEGVRERLRQLKGSLVFERMPGGGMRATVAIPLPGRKP